MWFYLDLALLCLAIALVLVWYILDSHQVVLYYIPSYTRSNDYWINLIQSSHGDGVVIRDICRFCVSREEQDSWLSAYWCYRCNWWRLFKCHSELGAFIHFSKQQLCACCMDLMTKIVTSLPPRTALIHHWLQTALINELSPLVEDYVGDEPLRKVCRYCRVFL